MKCSVLVSLVAWVVLFVVVTVVSFALSALHVFTNIEKSIGLLAQHKGGSLSNGASWFSAGSVLGYTLLAGANGVILITALATVGAVVYNLVTKAAGGIEITLQEAD